MPASNWSWSCRVSRDRQHPLAAQHMLGKPLRAGYIGQTTVKDLLSADFRETALPTTKMSGFNAIWLAS